MNEEESAPEELSTKKLLVRMALLVVISCGVGFLTSHTIFNGQQAVACSVFLGIILGTLFFWTFRLAIAFLGLSVLILANALDVAGFVQSSSLEVILFLVGMMVVVGALRDLGFFTWVVQLIVSMPNISGKKFIAVTAVASALLACAVDEVTSIIFISTLVFQVCDRLKLNPTPYILICVFCTNIGSAGTMMGNPVGIYIGTKAGLTFGDFMMMAFPIMIAALAGTAALTIWLYRKELAKFDVALQDRLARNLSLAPTVDVPYKRGLFLLIATVLAIASHHQIEAMLHLGKNSVLLIAPLICAGVVMIFRRARARYYIEREVDWWTLIFFMLLFAIAGTLEHTHVDQVMAGYFAKACGTSHSILVPFILFTSAVGSAFVDNVIFVAAFSPVIEQLSKSIKDLPLWWALLFGACFGGNITMIGSTANIVALGMLEKRSRVKMTFIKWLEVGLFSSLCALAIAWVLLMVINPFLPDRFAKLDFAMIEPNAKRVFDGKNIEIAAFPTGKAENGILPEKDFPAKKFNVYRVAPDRTPESEKQTLQVYLPASSEPLNAAMGTRDKLIFKGKMHTVNGVHALVAEDIEKAPSVHP